jgi:hypothetical protein
LDSPPDTAVPDLRHYFAPPKGLPNCAALPFAVVGPVFLSLFKTRRYRKRASPPGIISPIPTQQALLTLRLSLPMSPKAPRLTELGPAAGAVFFYFSPEMQNLRLFSSTEAIFSAEV